MFYKGGFTLIELLIVIVILGIISVIAIPKYIDLTTEARTSTIDGIVGSLASASAINYAARKANATKGVPIANCTDVPNALAGGIPSGYTVTAAAIAADATATCTVTGPSATTATFTATGIS